MKKLIHCFQILSVSILFLNQISYAKSPVIVISGGENPENNAERYYTKLETVLKLFPSAFWKQYFFVAGGPGEEPNSPFRDENGLELRDENNKVKLVRRDPPAGSFVYRAANFKDIHKTFREIADVLSPEDTVFLYMSDHGNLKFGPGVDKNKGLPVINLWYEWMTPDDLREVVRFLKGARRIVMIQDQCFSGDMLDSLFGIDALISKRNFGNNVCAFAAAAPGRTSYSTQQLIPTLDKYLRDPKLAPNIAGAQGKEIKFNELLRQSQIDFDTLPLTSSESFLLSYLESGRKKTREGDATKIGGQTKVQRQNYLNLVSKLEKLANGKFDRLTEVEMCKSFQSPEATEECLGRISRKERKTVEDLNRKLLVLKSTFMKSIPVKSRNLIEEYLPLSRTKVRNITAKLAEAEESKTPNLMRINKLKLKLQSEKKALANLAETANTIGQQQVKAFAGESPEFISFLEGHGKISELQDFHHLKETSRQIKEFKNLILKFQRMHQLLASLELIENDPEALEYYLNLVKCESEPLHTSQSTGE